MTLQETLQNNEQIKVSNTAALKPIIESIKIDFALDGNCKLAIIHTMLSFFFLFFSYLFFKTMQRRFKWVSQDLYDFGVLIIFFGLVTFLFLDVYLENKE